jgi:hypothetical protein
MIKAYEKSDLVYQELIDHIRSKQALIVVGTGISIAASGNHKCASWSGLIESGLNHCRDLGIADESWASEKITSLDNAIRKRDLSEILLVATALEKRLAGNGRNNGDWSGWLAKTVGKIPVTDPTLVKLVHTLGQGRVFTCNYDDVLRHPEWITVPWTQIDGMLTVAQGKQPGVVHLHGHWSFPESVVLGYDSYRAVTSDAAAQALERAIATLHSLVFVGFGTGLSDPNFGALIKWTSKALRQASHHHFALIKQSDKGLTPALQNRNLVKLVYGDDTKDLPGFLGQLVLDAGLTPFLNATPGHSTSPAATPAVPACATPTQMNRGPSTRATSSAETLAAQPDPGPNHNQYCSLHHQMRKHLIACDVLPAAGADRSNLHYAFVHVPSPHFVQCKDHVSELVARAVERGDISDVRVWPLLGSMELLLSYREGSPGTPGVFTAAVKQTLGKRLKQLVPVEVSNELVRPRTTPTANLTHSSMRNSWAFIHLRVKPKADDLLIAGLLKNIATKHMVIERIAFAHKPAPSTSDVVIELLMPCGMLPSLNHLSSELERWLANVASKSTYLAYDQYWPTGHEAGELGTEIAPSQQE